MIIVLIGAVIAMGAIGWLLLANRAVPTKFGWAADLTSVAGDGLRGHVDGPAAQARFSDPFALAVDAQGALYVADAGTAGRIRKIGADGRVTTLPGRFDTPSGVAIDLAGNVIVAETGANAIRKISPAGVVTTLAGGSGAGHRDGPARQALFNGPIGVAADGDGTVYVADSYNDRIRVIAPDGRVGTLAGGAAPGFADGRGVAALFHTPCGIILAADGSLLVADTGNDAIRRLGRDGSVSTIARTAPGDRTGPLKAPIGLARTRDGFLYISAFHGGRIVQMSPTGALGVLAGRDAAVAGNEALRLASPAGLALDHRGALYVADPARYAIRKLSQRAAGQAAKDGELRTAAPHFVQAAVVPWPVKPQAGWHEVVGTLGEVRGHSRGEARDHLHAGLDVSAGVGEQVVAVADEAIADPLPVWNLEGGSEGLRVDTLTYIHMRVGRTAMGTPLDPVRFPLVRDAQGRLAAVRVKRGTRLRAGDPLGTINRMAHVHLELGPPGGKTNALALRFAGLTDRFAPRIDGVQVLDGAGRPLAERHGGRLVVPSIGGVLAIVVDAWDQVDGNAARRRLGLYRAGFQILRADGRPAQGFEQPRINLVFDRLPSDREATKIAYAAASGDAVHSDQPTRFLYIVTNRVGGGRAAVGGWNPAGLTPGDYTIRIFAADFAGNQALTNRDLPITVR